MSDFLLLSLSGAPLCTLGDAKSFLWVLVAVRVVALMMLPTEVASTGMLEEWVVQVGPGGERATFASRGKF